MVKLENIKKRFNGINVLDGVNMSVAEGESIALIGSSGSGKTTLIRMINGFVIPDSGRITVGGKEIDYKNKEHLRQLRKEIGMIYQLFNLVERLTVLENVLSGALGRYDSGANLLASTIGIFPKREIEKARELISFVKLEDKMYERVDRLSGGQKQRVAIARALMQDPKLLLADEPIANLDPKTSKQILELLLRINEEKGITLICVLHHIDTVKDFFNRVVALKKGNVYYDGETALLDDDRIQDIYEFEEEMVWQAV